MPTPFESHLEAIANRITIKDEDRRSYTADFDVICQYIFNIMRSTDSDFDRICKGPSLFGSYSNNVRICYPNEFDVHIKLSFPFSSYINIAEDPDRAGFVNLDFSNVLAELRNVNAYDDVYELLSDDLTDWQNMYLRRSNLQRWITRILNDAFESNGYFIDGATGISYELEYTKRGLAHTVYAHDRTSSGFKHNISIDFVPAIMFGQAEWMTIRNYHPFRYKCNQWYAVPKPIDGPKETRKYAFMICCPKAEHDLLLGKQNLKVVFRLLKSLRNAYDLPRLKSYFITTAFLWQISLQQEHFWQQSLHDLLIHMLGVICDYFINGFLPFFWNENLNLLDNLYDDEIKSYADELCKAYNILITYAQQPKLTYARTLEHFKIPEGR